jgi:hypothetical protein
MFKVIKLQGYNNNFREINSAEFNSLAEAETYIKEEKNKDYQNNLDYDDFVYNIIDDILEYMNQLISDDDFFILEVQIQLTKNPYFFEIINDPYDKMSYFGQRDELILELVRLKTNDNDNE